MKLADTPSRSAGLIISVFGVPSSPMTPPSNGPAARARKRARAYGGAPVRSRIERGWTLAPLLALVHLLRVGTGLGLVLLRLVLRSRRVLILRLLRGRLGDRGLQLGQVGAGHRLARMLRVRGVDRQHHCLALIDRGQVRLHGVSAAVVVDFDGADIDRIAGSGLQPDMVGFAGP